VDLFEPVPAELFSGYREIRPLDPGFADRRELWRIFAYLAVIAVDGQNTFGRQHLQQLADTVERYG
jgi:fructosamine-3-kinase